MTGHWRCAFAQNVTTAPDGFDEIFAFCSVGQFLAQLADKHVDDFEFGFVHAAIKVVEEHFLGEGGALAEREQLEHLIFFAGQVNALATHFNCFGVEVHEQFAGEDN